MFEKFIESGKVIKGMSDLQKSKSLIKMSEITFKYATSIPIDDSNSSIILTNLYESLREILEAMCLREGYKVYSHEAFTFYLRKLNENEIAEKFDRFRKLRNGVNYYGKPVSKEVTINARDEIIKIKLKLREKYLKNL